MPPTPAVAKTGDVDADVVAAVGGGDRGEARLPGPLGEEEGQDQDVVDVGDSEQACGLADGAKVHGRTTETVPTALARRSRMPQKRRGECDWGHPPRDPTSAMKMPRPKTATATSLITTNE
jgi:hypothetical protein